MRLQCLLLAVFTAVVATVPITKSEFPSIAAGSFIQAPSEHPATHDDFMELYNKTSGAVNTTELVFGGQFAQPGNFPFQVYITYRKRDGQYYICGGSLVSPTHVLTAAHCTIDMIAPSRVMVGSTNVRQQTAATQWRNVHAINTHPRYRNGDPSFLNDIAMLEFSPPIQGNPAVQIVRILANDQQLLSTGGAYISGFGTYTFNGNQAVTSDNLRYAPLQLFNYNYCRQQWARFTGGRTQVTQTQVCAGAQGRGSGPGDSGGPLSVDTRNGLFQIALVSFGPMDPRIMANQQDQYPAVFTRLSSHCDFIAHYSRNTAKCL